MTNIISTIADHITYNLSANIIAGVALGVSYLAYRAANKKNKKDQDYFTEREIHSLLSSLLEKSYKELCEKNSEGNIKLTSSRINWMTASRYLLSYKKLKKQIKTPLYTTVVEETELFWRDKYSLLIEEINSSEFFKPWTVIRGTKIKGEQIYPASAAVILDFSQWDRARKDPLDEISFEQYVYENDLFSPKHRHFRDYIENMLPHLAKKVHNYTKD